MTNENPEWDRFVAWLAETHPHVMLTSVQREWIKHNLRAGVTVAWSHGRRSGHTFASNLLVEFLNAPS